MSNPLAGILGVIGGGLQGYTEDRARRVADALKARHQDEEERRNRVLDVLSGATTRHLNAQSTALEAPPSKPRGAIHFAQDGTPYEEIVEGGVPSLRAVPIVGASPVTKSVAPPSAESSLPGDQLEMGGGSASAPPVVQSPVMTSTPRFGAKEKFSRVAVKVNGKPGFALQNESGDFLDPATHRPMTGNVEPFTPPDKPSVQVLAGEGPDQPAKGVVIDASDPAHPKATTLDLPGTRKNFRVESATNTAAQARLEAAVSEMNNAHSSMAEYEQKLASGQVRINAAKQVLGRVANAFTHDDPISQLTQSGALAALNTTDPDLARYIRRGLSFAEGESMVSQRPSDFRTKMAAFLSTAASGASPEMIADIQGRRTSILNPLNATVKPSTSRTPPAVSSGATEDQRDWDAAVAKYGKAVVIKKYGPRP